MWNLSEVERQQVQNYRYLDIIDTGGAGTTALLCWNSWREWCCSGWYMRNGQQTRQRRLEDTTAQDGRHVGTLEGFRRLQKREGKVEPQAGWPYLYLWPQSVGANDVIGRVCQAADPNKRMTKETSRPPTFLLLGKGGLGGWGGKISLDVCLLLWHPHPSWLLLHELKWQ